MAGKKSTVTREDAYGNEVEVEVGADGENPVSPNNPPAKAVMFMSEDAYASTKEEEVVPEAEEEPEEDVEEEPEEEAEEEDDESVAEAPKKSASKAEWVDYAVSQGADRAQAEDSTRDDLIAAYGN